MEWGEWDSLFNLNSFFNRYFAVNKVNVMALSNRKVKNRSIYISSYDHPPPLPPAGQIMCSLVDHSSLRKVSR